MYSIYLKSRITVKIGCISLGAAPSFKIMVVDDEPSILNFIEGGIGKAKNLEFAGFSSPVVLKKIYYPAAF